MTAERRYLNLNAYLRNSGCHEAAWRVSSADPASVLDPRYYTRLAKTAERGVLDSIFLPDSPGVAGFRSGHLAGAGFGPLDARVIACSWGAGAADRFTIMPTVLPDQLTAFVDHVVPIRQKRGIARSNHAGRTLRGHASRRRPVRSTPALEGTRSGRSAARFAGGLR